MPRFHVPYMVDAEPRRHEAAPMTINHTHNQLQTRTKIAHFWRSDAATTRSVYTFLIQCLFFQVNSFCSRQPQSMHETSSSTIFPPFNSRLCIFRIFATFDLSCDLTEYRQSTQAHRTSDRSRRYCSIVETVGLVSMKMLCQHRPIAFIISLVF